MDQSKMKIAYVVTQRGTTWHSCSALSAQNSSSVIGGKPNAANTACGSAHWAHVLFREPNAHSVFGDKHYFVVAAG